jgi:uncharacterized RDD family membrane protein YckC
MATADILTGQFVILDQTPASIGDRIIARIIDMMVRVAYVIVALVFFTWVPSGVDDDFWSLILVLLVGLPLVLYTFLCELLFNGQTIGKMVMKIRTVSVDGSCPTMGSLFLRWLLEIVDVTFFFVGIIPIITTRRHQRFGDLAAGTMVIARPDPSLMHISLSEFQYAFPDYQPHYAGAKLLSLGQAELIERFVNVADRHGACDESALANLSRKVAAAIQAPGNPDSLQFLRTVLNDYRYYALNEVCLC